MEELKKMLLEVLRECKQPEFPPEPVPTRVAAVVEILDDTHFLVDVGDSPTDWDTIDATIDDIVKVIDN